MVGVHVTDLPRNSEREALLRHLSSDVKVTFGEQIPPQADYEILVAGRPGRTPLEASPRLRALIVPWAGIPWETRQLLADFPHLALHNLHHNAAPTAEMAMALLLAAAKRIVPIDQRLRKGDWQARYALDSSPVLEGKRALILGYGAVGQRVARACRALGMHIYAVRRHPALGALNPGDAIHGPSELHLLLPKADVLLICLPHTSETEGLLGEDELTLLPQGAILVNVGRGVIVDEKALYEALRDGRLAAAGLDVWYNYPQREEERAHTLPSSFPFHELENVVLSPHRAGASASSEEIRLECLAQLLNAAARGEEMPNRVDALLGY
jgi:phosphoglycerate dehydrogenase-like enzyme